MPVAAMPFIAWIASLPRAATASVETLIDGGACHSPSTVMSPIPGAWTITLSWPVAALLISYMLVLHAVGCRLRRQQQLHAEEVVVTPSAPALPSQATWRGDVQAASSKMLSSGSDGDAASSADSRMNTLPVRYEENRHEEVMNRFTVLELRQFFRDRRLPVSGRKSELVSRALSRRPRASDRQLDLMCDRLRRDRRLRLSIADVQTTISASAWISSVLQQR